YQKILKPFALGIFGIGASQINSGLDSIFARCASLEGPTYLWYAIRLQQLPLALFGIALASALLPPLARAIKGGDNQRYILLLQSGIKSAMTFILPASCALIVLGISSINLLFGRGNFTFTSVMHTTSCLWGYSIGLIPSVLTLLIAPAFYARGDYKTPAFGSLYSVFLNLLLNAYFVFGLKLGPVSIAIATGISSIFNAAFLFMQLEKRMDRIINFDMTILFIKISSAALVSGMITMTFGAHFLGDITLPYLLGKEYLELSQHLPKQIMQFGLQAISYLGIFLLLSKLFKADEVFDLYKRERGG
ncbi:MAG: polysaccharide biosynthesis C-terminal domain-containing protein, partial [Simkaniaceae bacterium]|nr:polysaccharide biosynthesis C-terminal domain-containing protein [Simkaniaceae bacterium]